MLDDNGNIMPPGQLKKNLQNVVDAVGGMFDRAIFLMVIIIHVLR